MSVDKKENTEQKPRLTLRDFYFADKHEKGSRMAIMLPSGADSGEWLQVMGPDCDASIKAGRAYTSCYRAVMAEPEMVALDAECKAKDNWTEYNEIINWRTEELNKQLAAEIVTGWSFDEPFSKEALMELLNQYRGLAEAVAKHHADSRAELSAK